jgi:hypothetical protein
MAVQLGKKKTVRLDVVGYYPAAHRQFFFGGFPPFIKISANNFATLTELGQNF